MADSDCTLDQWMTSAAAAMDFAYHNWDEFAAFTEGVIGEPVPIDAETMLHHAKHVIDLTDPERMPSG